jgi:hypothetical protein
MMYEKYVSEKRVNENVKNEERDEEKSILE